MIWNPRYVLSSHFSRGGVGLCYTFFICVLWPHITRSKLEWKSLAPVCSTTFRSRAEGPCAGAWDLKQYFSTSGDFAPRGYLELSVDLLIGSQEWCGEIGILWVETRGDAEHPTVPRIAPTHRTVWPTWHKLRNPELNNAVRNIRWLLSNTGLSLSARNLPYNCFLRTEIIFRCLCKEITANPFNRFSLGCLFSAQLSNYQAPQSKTSSG